MEKLDSTLTSPPIPSASALTGTVRPKTAAAAVGVAYETLNRKPKRGWTTASDIGASQRAPGQVTELSKIASKHLGALTATRPAPYSRPITPADRKAAETKLMTQLTKLASALQEAQASTSTSGGEQGMGAPAAGGEGGDPAKPSTPAALIKSLRDSLNARPASSLSVQDFTMQRPASKAGRLPGVPGSLSASWSGPLPRPGTAPVREQTALTTPPRTPTRLGSRGGPLRASAPVPLALLAAAVGAKPPPGSLDAPEVWVNPTALPSASKASDAAAAAAASAPGAPPGSPKPAGSSAELQRERMLLRSSMGNRAAADATGSQAAAAAAAAATARLLARTKTPGGLPTNAESDAAAVSVSQSLGARSTLGAKPGLAPPPVGAPGNPRWGPGQPLERFVPTRGMVYSVFNELDDAGVGKLTFSMFESAAVKIGLKHEQVQRLYNMLDPQGRGYFTVQDWGRQDHFASITDFTRLYVQVTRGASGRPENVREMVSAALALQVALIRLQVKNNGRSVSRAKLMEAFEFLDTDRSGSLTVAEMADAFNGMGIYVADAVLDEIMAKFDTNRNGTIEYDEFVHTLFPVLSKSLAIE